MELANPRIFKTKYICFENIELANPRIFQKKINIHKYGTGQPWKTFKCMQLLQWKLSMSKRRNNLFSLHTLYGWNFKYGGTKYRLKNRKTLKSERVKVLIESLNHNEWKLKSKEREILAKVLSSYHLPHFPC